MVQNSKPAQNSSTRRTRVNNRVDSNASSSQTTTSTTSIKKSKPPPTAPKSGTAYNFSRVLLSAKMAPISPISPRSGNYNRLEGGMGPSRTGAGKNRFAWKKFAIAAGVLIALVWLLGPRATSAIRGHKDKEVPWHEDLPDYDFEHHEDDHYTDTHPGSVKTPAGLPQAGKQPPIVNDRPPPTSFETDHDPAGTTFCTTPYKGAARLVQYAIMMDAGSQGSRIHVYKFNNCGPSLAYEYETFKMVQGGLSKYGDRPLEGAKSLDVLLAEAMRVIPDSLKKCTPIAVKATAGLRLLGSEKSNAILKAVTDHLEHDYPFPLKKGDVVIMDGKDEGVYAWITANYLLNTIRADTPANTPTYAVLDLGGASTQIVFEPTFAKPDSSLVDGDHKYRLDFGGKTHELYQHSYLGYGTMQARVHIHRLVDFMATLKDRPIGPQSEPSTANPCLAQGTKRVIEIKDEITDIARNVTMDGGDIGSYEACNRLVQLVLAKDAICEVKPCSFDGVYQPSLLDTFPHGKILLLSYFYDRISPLIAGASTSKTPPKATISTIASLAKDVCAGKPTWTKRWGKDKALMDELEGRPEWCLDLTFQHALLRLGYEFEDKRDVSLGKQIDGTELGWCLGATLAMVGGELKCKI